MYPPAKTNPVGLSEKIKSKVGRVLAECANIDMDLSKNPQLSQYEAWVYIYW